MTVATQTKAALSRNCSNISIIYPLFREVSYDSSFTVFPQLPAAFLPNKLPIPLTRFVLNCELPVHTIHTSSRADHLSDRFTGDYDIVTPLRTS